MLKPEEKDVKTDIINIFKVLKKNMVLINEQMGGSTNRDY